MKNIFTTQRGYTLIEMLIVLSLMGLIIPIIFSILYVLLNMQLKMYRLIETKRQGDRIMTFMKEKITREAVAIRRANGTSRCTTYTGSPETTTNGADFIFVKDTSATPPTFHFSLNNDTLFTQDSTNMASTSLHDTRIEVSDFRIQCFKRNNTLNPFQVNQDVILIGFSYTVHFVDNSPTSAEGDTSLQYHTKIRLR